MHTLASLSKASKRPSFLLGAGMSAPRLAYVSRQTWTQKSVGIGQGQWRDSTNTGPSRIGSPRGTGRIRPVLGGDPELR
jgi:hypothetical protein